MKNLLNTLCFLMLVSISFTQTINVADLTFKLEGKTDKTLHYTFYKGDEIVLSLEEIEGKEISEVSFGPYNASPLYQNYKVNKVEGKTIRIEETKVYELKIANTDGRSKFCKTSIGRNSPEYNKNFSTQVQWREVSDTIFDIKKENVTTGFRTVQKQKSRKVLASVDTANAVIIDRVERVHSMANVNSANVSILRFEIPNEIAEPSVFNPMKETKVVAWAYTINTQGDVKQWYEAANSKAGQALTKVMGSAMGVGNLYMSLFEYASKGISYFSTPPTGNNVKYELGYNFQGVWAPIKGGNSVASWERITEVRPGQYAFKLINDNLVDGINVDIKIVTVSITKNYELQYYTVEDQEPIKETKIIKTPKKISVTRVPIFEVIRP